MMDLAPPQPLTGWRARLNVRLHPLLAAGIGLGLFALLLPGTPSGREEHKEEEILARLTAPALDLEHGPSWWLRARRTHPELFERGVVACTAAAEPQSTNCAALLALASLAAEGER